MEAARGEGNPKRAMPCDYGAGPVVTREIAWYVWDGFPQPVYFQGDEDVLAVSIQGIRLQSHVLSLCVGLSRLRSGGLLIVQVVMRTFCSFNEPRSVDKRKQRSYSICFEKGSADGIRATVEYSL
jgi:hypothetical protein